MTIVFLFLYFFLFLFPGCDIVLIFYLPNNLNDLEKVYSIHFSLSVSLNPNYEKQAITFAGVLFFCFLDLHKNDLVPSSPLSPK